MKEIKSLTGLRGIAALYVILQHLHLDKIVQSKWVMAFLSHGYLAVDIFFMLSGFVMMSSYEDKFLHGYNINFKEYIVKRFARIYPLYLAVLFLCFLIFAVLKTNWIVNPKTIDYITNILLLQIPFSRDSFLYPSWSLSVEWCVYFILPILVTFLSRFTDRSLWIPLVLSFAVLWSIMFYTHFSMLHGFDNVFQFIGGYLNIFQGWPAFTKGLTEFFIGMTVFRFFKKRYLSKFIYLDIMVLIVIFILMFVFNSDFYIVLLFPLFIYMVSFDQSTVGRILSNKLINKIGLWSYSIYLIHPLLIGKPFDKILNFVHSVVGNEILSYWSAIPIVIAIIVFLSKYSYSLVEVKGKAILIKLFL